MKAAAEDGSISKERRCKSQNCVIRREAKVLKHRRERNESSTFANLTIRQSPYLRISFTPDLHVKSPDNSRAN